MLHRSFLKENSRDYNRREKQRETNAGLSRGNSVSKRLSLQKYSYTATKSRVILETRYVSPRIVLQARSAKNSGAVTSRGRRAPVAFSLSSSAPPSAVFLLSAPPIGPGPAGGLRADGERAAKLITTAPQTRNYAWTAHHELCYRTYDVRYPRTKSRFRIAAAAARKNDRPRTGRSLGYFR